MHCAALPKMSSVPSGQRPRVMPDPVSRVVPAAGDIEPGDGTADISRAEVSESWTETSW